VVLFYETPCKAYVVTREIKHLQKCSANIYHVFYLEAGQRNVTELNLTELN